MIFSILKFIKGLRGTSKGCQIYVQAESTAQAAAKVQAQGQRVEVRPAKNQDCSTYKKLIK
jgi:hypothetical protein